MSARSRAYLGSQQTSLAATTAMEMASYPLHSTPEPSSPLLCEVVICSTESVLDQIHGKPQFDGNIGAL